MIKRNIPIILVFIGLITSLNNLSFAVPNFKIANSQDAASLKIKIKVEYLGNPAVGAVVSVIDKGRVLAKSTTNRKGKVAITIKDLGSRTVDLKIMKEGYKTQILSGIILVDKSKYEFSLMKGEGVSKEEVETAIPDIQEKSEEKMKKIDKSIKKYQEKAKKYTEKAEKENQRRTEAEKETSKIKRELSNTNKAIKQLIQQLSSIDSTE